MAFCILLFRRGRGRGKGERTSSRPHTQRRAQGGTRAHDAENMTGAKPRLGRFTDRAAQCPTDVFLLRADVRILLLYSQGGTPLHSPRGKGSHALPTRPVFKTSEKKMPGETSGARVMPKVLTLGTKTQTRNGRNRRIRPRQDEDALLGKTLSGQKDEPQPPRARANQTRPRPSTQGLEVPHGTSDGPLVTCR